MTTNTETLTEALLESAYAKVNAGDLLTKDEANAYFAESLTNPTNQVYFRAGLIACREYMARFVEAESPAIAASIRANWWPCLGQDLGVPRQIKWEEIATGGEEGPWAARDDINPTLEALPLAFQFLQGQA
jgi:hypothetical protein